jgi:hypothetical protein
MKEHIESHTKRRQDENPELLKGARAYLDSDNLKDRRSLLDNVRNSKVLVVLLTKRYFTRPWCLAELHAALEGNVPIVPVNLIGGGYNFVEGAQFLSTLTPQTLDQTGVAGASAVLQDIGIDITELGKKLFAVLPKLIAVSFNPNEVPRVLEAQLDTD